MKNRTIAIMLALALLLIPLSVLAEDEGEQYRIGTTGAICVQLGELDPDVLKLNGYPYRPDISITNWVTINAGDLLTALKLDIAKDELQKQGIDVSDLYIRSGKIFMSGENDSDMSDAQRAQRLADARAILGAVDVSAYDLAGKTFEVSSSGDLSKTFTIASVWHSPIEPPAYDPADEAAPPPPSKTAAPLP